MAPEATTNKPGATSSRLTNSAAAAAPLSFRKKHQQNPTTANASSYQPTAAAAATTATTTATPSGKQMRRKAPLETLQELTHVQRLVEYFIVVSCRSRDNSVERGERDAEGGYNATKPTSKNSRRGISMQRSASSSKRRNSFINRRNHSSSNNHKPLSLRGNRELPPDEPGHSSSQSTTTTTTTHSGSSRNSTTAASSAALSQSHPQHPEPLLRTKSTGNNKKDQQTAGNIHMTDEGADHTFRPTITSRYPLEDHADNPLNPMVVQFCHPVDDVIVPSKSYELPRIHHFVLTNERGRKIYGTCLTVFEEHVPPLNSPWNQHSLTEEDDSSLEGAVELSMSPSARRKALYLPKVLCLLSTWPYLTAFREYLSQLYRLAVLTDAMIAPIERFVVNLYEIPAPPPGAYEVQVSILNSTIRFWAPPAKLPIAYTALPFQILFECLDVDNVLQLWSAMLMERKILLVSSQHSILTVCSEILCSLLFPMRWSHLYVPLLPKMLCPMLDAPGT
jgi:DENN (AEX-3) domain/uDENN domain